MAEPPINHADSADCTDGAVDDDAAVSRTDALSMPSTCRQPEPDHRDEFLSEDERDANKTMMICCSRAKSATLVLDL